MSEYTVIDITPIVTVVEVPFVVIPNVDAPPSNVSPPSIGGPDTPRVGDTLTAWPGVWDAVVDSYAYQWYRDDVAIAGATGIEYGLVGADEGADITVGVVATNAEGDSPEVTSAAVGPVQAPAGVAPGLGAAPTWSAVWQSAETATITPGDYVGSPTITIERYLQLGPDGVSWPSAVPLAGTTTFLVHFAGLFEYARVREIATNAEGSVTAYSSIQRTYPTGALPIATTPPKTTADGGLAVGDVVGTCGAVWDGQGAEITGYVYRYLRDGSPIAGATSSTYTLTAPDQGTELTPQVAGVSSVGTGAWVSADTVAVPT